jgi:hypothetical protein
MATLNDDGLQLWRVNPNLLKLKSIVAPPGGDLGQFHFREVAWSPGGHTLAVLDEGTIDLYDAQNNFACTKILSHHCGCSSTWDFSWW